MLCFALVAPFAHAGFFSNIWSNPITNFIDAVTAPIQNFFGGVANAVSNIISPSTPSKPSPSTPTPSGGTNGSAPSGYTPIGGTGIGTSTGGGWTGNNTIPTYVKYDKTFVNIKEVGFSDLELTNLYIETVLPDNKVMADNYVNIFHEISNIGSQPGSVKWRTDVSCYAITDPAGNSNTTYEVVQRTDWIQSRDLTPGSVNSFLTSWYVPKEKYQWGGHCKVSSEIADNVRRTNLVENVFCSIISWVTGETTQDCSTTTENKTTVETRGNTKKTTEFDIEAQIPRLRGTLGNDFFGAS
jgi:hypothetical protein